MGFEQLQHALRQGILEAVLDLKATLPLPWYPQRAALFLQWD
jgi:hypothetical protein